jgi:eukaryotic-like serine/threonine-protein kinase
MINQSDTLVGQVLGGKYKIIKRLGRGGMAEVYLAHQENLDRQVAIKLMHAFLLSDEDFLNRFKREAKAMAALNHRHIVSVYDFDTYGQDSYYLVMEYINGGTLKARLEQLAAAGERMPLERVVKLTTQMAEALAYAHKRGMVHRDIKPGNIMLDEETGKAILTDFGIVKMLGGQTVAHTMTGALIGTPAYMSPEQALGKPGDARADIYSLGILLFQMTTGKLPFAADTPLAVVMKHVNDPTPLPVNINPDTPPGLQAVIIKAMAKQPEERYQSAAEMAAALRAIDLLDLSTPAMLPPVAESDAVPIDATTVESIAGMETEIVPAGTATQVVATPAETEAVTPTTTASPIPAAASSGRPLWFYGLIVLLLLLTGGGMGAALGLFGGSGENGDDSQAALVAAETNTPTITITTTATETVVPQETPDVVGSAVAAVRLTEEAQPTGTPTLTPTQTPTYTPTPDRTLDFLGSCVDGIELVNHFTYNSPNFRAAWAGENFAMNWVLRNSGTCPWPDDTRWTYISGETFGYDDEGLLLGETVNAGDEIELRIDLNAPATPRQYESVWQLIDADDNPVSDPITYTVSIQVRATATPTRTPTPAVTATSTPSAPVAELNYLFEVLPGSCQYQVNDWRCQVRITPYGGGGGPYTVLVFDLPGGQATEFRGSGPFNYFPGARRCAAFNSNVRVIDDSQTPALLMDRHLYVDPNLHFAGGCTLP